MNLTNDQLDRFDRDGFLILPDLFSPAEVAVLRAELLRCVKGDSPLFLRFFGCNLRPEKGDCPL